MKGFKIKHKLITSIILIFLVTALLGITANYANKTIVNDHQMAVKYLNELNALKHREVHHLEWAESLKGLLFLNGEEVNSNLHMNHTECEFGLWLETYINSNEFEDAPNDYREIILGMHTPHKELHESASLAVEAYLSGDYQEAIALYENVTVKKLDELRGLIKEAEQSLSRQANVQLQMAERTIENTNMIKLISILLGVFSCAVIITYLSRSTITPITKIVAIIKNMTRSDGKYRTIRIAEKDDELGDLVKAFNKLVNQVKANEVHLEEKNEELLKAGEELSAQNEEILAQQDELQGALFKLTNQEEVLSKLYKFSQVLNKTIKLSELMDSVLSELIRETDCQGGVFYLYNKQGKNLKAKAVLGLNSKADFFSRVELGEGLAGRAAQEKELLVANYSQGQLQTKSISGEVAMAHEIYIPLMYNEELLGLIALGRLEADKEFTQTEQRLLNSQGVQIGVALDNVFAHHQTRQALKQIQAVDKLKSELINTVSHELRTPLASILGFAELLLKKAPSEKRAKKYLNTIHSEAMRLTSLINDFLDLQRIETGRMEFDKESVDLKALVEKTADIYRGQSNLHDINIKADEELPKLLTDPDKVIQVLGNFISNAIKYSPEGGSIDVDVFLTSQNQVQVQVQDSGLGIPEDALKNMFQPFFRVDNSDRRQIGGTGLGLAISKKIINTLGGKIGVESKHGEGSKFFFTLPLAEDQENIYVDARDNHDSYSVKNTYESYFQTEAEDNNGYILVVEDDQSMAQFISEALNEAGYKIKVTDNGLNALELIKKELPKAIVLDLILPGNLDGWDIMRRLKQDSHTSTIPIIISSSIDNKKVNQNLEVADYLVKPFSAEVLVESIKTMTKITDGVVGVPQQEQVQRSEEVLEELLEDKGFSIKDITQEENLIVVKIKSSLLEDERGA